MPPLAPGQLELVDSWIRSLLWEGQVPGEPTNSSEPIEIHRLKSRLIFKDGNVKMVQGVREVFEIFDGEQAPNEDGVVPQAGKLVLIGRGVQGINFETSLLNAIQDIES